MQKTILIITDNLPDQVNGVVTTYKNIEICAIQDGYHVVYLSPKDFEYFDCPFYKEIKISWPRQLDKKIKQINPDHIHIATEGPIGLGAKLYLSKNKIPYNTAYHTKFPEATKQLTGIPECITWAYVRWFHNHSGRVLTTTESMVHDLQKHDFNGNIISWSRGVDRSIFYPTEHKKNNQIILVCISRISKEKNLEQFFEMEYSNARKIMVGDGPMMGEYRDRYPDVEFTGFKTGSDLAEYYRMADVFVFPSRWETFGLVMIEAMACGTPVAAYPCQGPLDVVDEGITGCMNENLQHSVYNALQLNRHLVWKGSQRWSWEHAWNIFRDNLV